MEIDVIHLLLVDACVFHRQLQCAGGLPAVGHDRHPVIGVAGGAVTDQLRIDRGLAFLGVLQLFHHQHPAPLGQHKPFPVAVERTRAAGGVLIEMNRVGPQALKPRHHGRGHTGFHAAGQHPILLPGTDGIEGIAHRVGRTGASVGNHMTAALQAEKNGNFTRQHPHQGIGNGVGADFVQVPGIIMSKLLFRKVETRAAGAHQHTQTFKILLIEFIEIDSGILQSFLRRGHTQGNGPRHFFQIGFRIEVARNKTVHLPGDLAVQPRWIKTADTIDAADAVAGIVPEFLSTGAVGTDNSQPGKDNSS